MYEMPDTDISSDSPQNVSKSPRLVYPSFDSFLAFTNITPITVKVTAMCSRRSTIAQLSTLPHEFKCFYRVVPLDIARSSFAPMGSPVEALESSNRAMLCVSSRASSPA
uniref:(northern house mosquito) hypothetical protein n=1 Tax=Culex pipiens TaxID=7175 RepID=A0A8D8FPB9_CULPI